MTHQSENELASVPEGDLPSEAKQAGETDGRWSWVERIVWTKNMLTALCNGVKGGKWFSLWDKVTKRHNLYAAWPKVLRNKGAAGVDHQTIEMFDDNSMANLDQLHKELQEGTYRPRAIRRAWIEKPGSNEKRPLGIPTVRDRTVQTALRNVLEPIFENEFAEHSYGFRPGRSCHDALDRVEQLLEEGYRYVVDADLRQYFDTIPRERLLERIKEKVSDGKVLSLIEQFLSQNILEGMCEWTPTAGCPQGAVISPLLSNIYLNPLDHLMAQAGFEMVRYADDFVLMCRSRQEAVEALEKVQQWTADNGLTLHPTKTKIVDAVEEGFEFLGYRYIANTRVPRDKSIARLKDTIRRKTRRRNGQSLDAIIANVNLTLRGWYTYFRRSNGTPFEKLDGFIRRRLRTLLRRRRKRKGQGHTYQDHKAYPNAFFENRGLFSLASAQDIFRQSAQAGNH